MSVLDPAHFLPSKPRVIEEDERRGIYEITRLYPGYGHTLGNSLRRIVLSSLTGTAVTSFKVEGVEHEFSTIPGIKEDVVMIMLGLKKVNFVVESDEPQILYLRGKGVKTLTAGDIETGGQVQILNPDLPLVTLTDKTSSLNLEMVVEKGLGYVPKEVISHGKSEVGRIFMDAVFTPIRRASYEVENMRVGDRTDYNLLRFTIETNGLITPRRSLERAIEIMIVQLKAIIGFQEEAPEVASAATGTETEVLQKELAGEVMVDVLKTRLDDLNLSTRTQKALIASGIRTVGGLTRKTENDLLEISGFGQKGLQEVKRSLADLGLSLKS